jgi:hypothetical protein
MSGSIIDDHPFVPRRAERADWDLCLVCHLSIAAHERAAGPAEAASYRVPAFKVETFGPFYSWTREPRRPRLRFLRWFRR